MKKNATGLDRYVKGPKVLDYLFNVILNPTIWVVYDGVSKDANRLLDLLIEKYLADEISIFDSSHKLQFGDKNIDIKVRTSNYPYSYGHVYEYKEEGLGIIKYAEPTRYAKVLFRRFESEIRKHKTEEGNIKKDVNVILKSLKNDRI